MRRRPPATLVVYMLVVAVALAAWAIGGEDRLQSLPGFVLLVAGATGVVLRVRAVWIALAAIHAVALLIVVAYGYWALVLVDGGLLALLLAPPTRRYVRGEPEPEPDAARRGRAIAISVVAVGVALAGTVAYALVFATDKIAGDLDEVRSDEPGQRVLFIGNTITSDHEMPAMVRRLAEADTGGPVIFTVRYAKRGSTLADASEDADIDALLDDERWTDVVLQEHSQVVSRPEKRTALTHAAASELAQRAGGRPVLYVNWAYEDGDPEVDDDSWIAMETRMRDGYSELAAQLPAALAPVGVAWNYARRDVPRIDLYARDGIRPSAAGSYLAACVLYAVLTGRDPTRSSFTGGLDGDDARALQRIAAQAVRDTSGG